MFWVWVGHLFDTDAVSKALRRIDCGFHAAMDESADAR